jgi:RHS repeat-associated protein
LAVQYARLPGSDLVSGYTADPLAVTKTYEPNRDLIAAVSNHVNPVNPVLISAYDYVNDAAGRRVSRNADAFGYNARSEVTSAAIGTNGYAYAYDPIGNRVWSAMNTLTNTYTANRLNQYTLISNPVNPVNPVQTLPTYDADGNMRWDGKMRHFWDAENRLVQSQPYGIATNGAVRLEYSYNHKNLCVARIKKRLSGRGAGYPLDPSQPGSWDAVETRRYVWDGYNIAAEIVIDEVTPSTNVTYYTWGLDLSGTLQGAGGVGGLLAVIRSDGTFFPCYDANGNVTDYVDAAGNIRAHYEYSPFGEIVAQSGDMADTFTHRFSTKPFDVTTGKIHYELRPYDSPLGRWLPRDPLGDEVFLQQYTSDMNRSERKHWRERSMRPTYLFVQNNPLLFSDYLGLDLTYSGCKCCPEIDDAVRRVNRAFRKGACKEWFEEHGHNYSLGTPNRSVACHGNWKIPCMLGFPAWTMPGMGIGVCDSKCKELGSVALASLLVHELAHHYCTYGLGREKCAISAQEACSDALTE